MTFPLSLGRVACDLVEDPKLRRLMRANRLRLSFEWEDVDANALEKIDASGFVSLENVPDVVWKRSMTAGFPAGRRGRENPTHYADLDEPHSNYQTLLDWLEAPTDVPVSTFKDYLVVVAHEQS